jgi:PDZ domain-containing secreted protein
MKALQVLFLLLASPMLLSAQQTTTITIQTTGPNGELNTKTIVVDGDENEVDWNDIINTEIEENEDAVVDIELDNSQMWGQPCGPKAFIGINYNEDYNKPKGGVRITGFVKGSAAEKSDLEEGDILLAIDNQPIDNSEMLCQALKAYQPGDKVVLKVKRQRKERQVTLVLGEKKQDNDFNFHFDMDDMPNISHDAVDENLIWINTGGDERPRMGIRVTERDGEILVETVEPGSPAEQAGLEPGDQITTIEDRDVHSSDDVVTEVRARSAGDTMSVVVVRNGTEKEYKVTLQNLAELGDQMGRQRFIVQRDVEEITREAEGAVREAEGAVREAERAIRQEENQGRRMEVRTEMGRQNTGRRNITIEKRVSLGQIPTPPADNELILDQLDFFPNPASDQLRVRIKTANAASMDLSLIDISGKTLVSHQAAPVDQIVEHTFDTKGLAAGNYSLVIRQGDKILTEQVVISE